MSYNALIGINIDTDVTTEPVTLTEVKQHLNMQFDTDESYEFNDDDTYLTDLITECREILEKVTGYSLAPKTITATINNSIGSFELPYGPVIGDITTITDEDGEDIDDVTVRSGKIVTCGAYQVVTYNAGYETLPAGLKRALLEEIAWRYNHRGDEDIQEPPRKLAKLYKKRTWLL